MGWMRNFAGVSGWTWFLLALGVQVFVLSVVSLALPNNDGLASATVTLTVVLVGLFLVGLLVGGHQGCGRRPVRGCARTRIAWRRLSDSWRE